jgi:FkbH-like protein
MFNRMCRSVEDVYPLDMEEIAGRIGKSNAFDHKSYYCNRYPFSMLMTNEIAAHLKAVCLQFLRYPLKCIVLDLDNTLWGGIVGEIGTENILLSDSGEGKAFYDFQAEIVKLHKRGVILAVCSKNNTCDALDVFERHPHMLIKASMISSFRINWDDKPDNILQISAELKIGLDSIMFVDDNLSERAITKAVLPSVEIFELPDNPFLFADSLRRCTRFWPVQLTLDDTKKGAYFSQESKRLQARKLIENKCEFLRDSAIKVTISVGNSEAIPRIVQLFNKTNQFNLTTKRYCQNEIVKLTAQKENHLFYMDMCDRFGDYGVIASALIVDNTIDSFLLSCRAFGKYVEFAFLYQILHRLQNQGSMLVTGVYVATEKNGMAKDFYKIAGFKPVGEGKWTFDLMQEIPAGPDWIVVS